MRGVPLLILINLETMHKTRKAIDEQQAQMSGHRKKENILVAVVTGIFLLVVYLGFSEEASTYNPLKWQEKMIFAWAFVSITVVLVILHAMRQDANDEEL